MGRIRYDAVDRTDADAGLVIIKAHTLGAEIGVNLVHLVTHGDGLIGTLRLTHIAVDALLRDQQRHITPQPGYGVGGWSHLHRSCAAKCRS